MPSGSQSERGSVNRVATGIEELSVPVDWAYWKSVNEDVVAWVEVPGTGVSQPVVQADPADPLYYLSHDVYGSWNPFGCPYVDSGCAGGLDSQNVVIVGHNISFPPAIFHDLERFRDDVFASTHDRILLHTPDGTRRYRLAGVETVPGCEAVKRVAFSGDADFRAYLHERLLACDVVLQAADEVLLPQPCYVSVKAGSIVSPHASAHASSMQSGDGAFGKGMLTLCTCSYFENPVDERTLLYALSE